MIRLGGWYWYLSGEERKLESIDVVNGCIFLKISHLHSRYARRPLWSTYAMSANALTWKCS